MNYYFICKIFKILMSLIQIGTIYKYLSNALLRGFTTAAAFLVLSSQVQHLFGIYNVGIRRHKYFKIFFVGIKNFFFFKKMFKIQSSY